jgi:hypothetical protein
MSIPTCLACKRKDSMERCTNKSLPNFMYCGRHIKIKDVKPWIASHETLLCKIIKIQAIWRGILCRRPLQLAGKGVLKRSLCVNDEELITLDDKHTISPFDFFSLEEDGKVWFFDQKTINQLSQKDLVVRNPYTRRQLSNEDMARIRKLYVWRRKQKLPVFHDIQEPLNAIEKRDRRWLRIVQILREAGFEEIHYEHFIALNYPQMATFVNSLVEDIRWWTHEKSNRPSKYVRWLINMRNLMHTYRHQIDLSSDIACILLTILLDVTKIQDISFHIYNAYQRAEVIVGIHYLG